VIKGHKPYHGVVHQMQQLPLPNNIPYSWNLFNGIEEFFSVTRYHSLCVDSGKFTLISVF
jgi:anthranilate/para-aminobenzoate synthase component II